MARKTANTNKDTGSLWEEGGLDGGGETRKKGIGCLH